MDNMRYFVGLVLHFVVSTVFAQTNCPLGLTSDLERLLTLGNYCYFFSSEDFSFSQSNNSCAQNGGYLAVVNDMPTAQALATHANTVSDITAKSSYWIGLRRENATYIESVLGGQVSYSNFAQQGADGTGQEGCVRLDLPDGNGSWITGNCANRDWFNGYICQYVGQNSAATLQTFSFAMLLTLVLTGIVL